MLILDIFARLVIILIDAAMVGIFLRMILSFFLEEDSKITLFFACITEPFIVPVRFMLYKFNILQDSPIDWSGTLTYLVLAFVKMLLPAV